MIMDFVKAFDTQRDALHAKYTQTPPQSYLEIVTDLVTIIHQGLPDSVYYGPDPTRITSIDHGEFQGTLVFVIGAEGYQPSTYWYTMVDYGSCNGCDTLQGIEIDHDDTPEGVSGRATDYVTLALHMLQRMKQME
jgi:hypothetical protein